MQPKSVPCVFIGYSSGQNAYKCFDPQAHKSYLSRQVLFDEHHTLLSTELPSTTTNAMQPTSKLFFLLHAKTQTVQVPPLVPFALTSSPMPLESVPVAIASSLGNLGNS